MDRSQLVNALRAHQQLAKELEASSAVVWTALADAEPDLAAEILQLFSTVEAASRWATSRSGDLDESPADRVADGRAAEVLSLVRKTAHGFVG